MAAQTKVVSSCTMQDQVFFLAQATNHPHFAFGLVPCQWCSLEASKFVEAYKKHTKVAQGLINQHKKASAPARPKASAKASAKAAAK